MLLSLLALALACSGSPAGDSAAGDGGGSATDTASEPGDGGTPQTDTADPCADVPLVNYSTFGAGFITANCQGCHASTAPERFGAPESVVFDTVEQVWTWSVRILQLVPGDEERMPPAGGITENDATRLRWWLECAEPGT